MLSVTLSKVKSLRHVSGDLESEWHLSMANSADIVFEALHERGPLPCSHIPFMLVSLALATVGDSLTHIDELEFNLNAIGRYSGFAMNVNLTNNRVVSIEGANTALEVNSQARAL